MISSVKVKQKARKQECQKNKIVLLSILVINYLTLLISSAKNV